MQTTARSRVSREGTTIMHAKTRIALAAVLIVGAASNAMARSSGLNADAPFAASQDVAARASLFTAVGWGESPRSTHFRHRQSRNAGLGTDGYATRGFQADNNQYWRKACCLYLPVRRCNPRLQLTHLPSNRS